MGFIRIMERGGEELREYKKALKMAKQGIETLCELTEEMEDQFSERSYDPYRMDMRYHDGGYSERDYYRGYYGRDMDGMDERRGRDSMGRYTRR